MAVQFISSLTLNTLSTVEVRAMGNPFKSQRHPERCFLKVVDATDMIFITGLGDLSAMLLALKRGQNYKISNVLVEKNHIDFVDRAPFNEYRLVITPHTVIEKLSKDHPGLPPITEGSIKYLELTATSMIQSQSNNPFKVVRITAIDDMENEWQIKMHGPFYRQWMRSLHQGQVEFPLKVVFNGVEKDRNNVHLLPRSEFKILNVATLSPVHSYSSSEEPLSCSSDSKKRKRDSSCESAESAEEEERDCKRFKSEPQPLVSPNAVTSASSDDVQPQVEPDSELTTWQVGKDQVLVITSKEHFDRMAGKQQASLEINERPSSFWKNAVRLGFLTAVAALGGLYFITPDKIVVFLSLANFFKIIV